MCGGLWMTLAQIVQMLDPVYGSPPGQPEVQIPVWPIEESEAALLGPPTAALVNSLPAQQKKTLAKIINKWAPAIGLTAAVYEVFGPRAKYSYDLKQKAAKERAKPPLAAVPNGRPHTNGRASVPEGPSAEGAPSGPGSGTRPGAAANTPFWDS